MTPDDFPVDENLARPVHRRTYRFFGFAGDCADRSIRLDRPDWLQECIDRGYIDTKCRMIDGQTLRQFCMDVGSTKCGKLLENLGWPLNRA